MAQKLIKRKRKAKSKKANSNHANALNTRLAVIENSMIRKDLPEFRAGDTVKVHVRIKEGDKFRNQIFEGVVISKKGGGAAKSFTVRKISHGVGVERIFMEASPKIAKLEVVESGIVRRAKLYYLRELVGKAAKLEKELDTGSAGAATPAAH